jgi:hypothetical protein
MLMLYFILVEYLSFDVCDIQDNYCIIIFEGLELLNGSNQLKSHLTLANGPNQPSDKFLHLHFMQCLRVSICCGNVSEDYEEQEIDNFIEGVYEGKIDNTDPRWSTPLGVQVQTQLISKERAR